MATNWDWFCKPAINDTATDSFINFTWDAEHTVYNACFVDLVTAAIHAGFLVFILLVLFIWGCCTQLKHFNRKWQILYPGADARWLITFLLLLVLLCGLGEGILSAFNKDTNTPLQLYLPPLLAFLTACFSIIYYHNFEAWDRPNLSLLLFVYWPFCILSESLKVANLKHNFSDMDFISLVKILRFDVALASLVFYCSLFVIELNLLRTKVCCAAKKPPPKEIRNPRMMYYHRYVNLISCVSYWWLNWLLSMGYKKPLEISDLGVLSHQHEAKYNYLLIKNAYEKEKKRVEGTGKTPSLTRCFVRAYGVPLGLAGFLKLAGDLLSFVGPLAIGGIVAYALDPSATISDDEYISVSDFFSNGYVLVIVMFLASAIRSLVLQTHYYITIIESIHVKAAIQMFVYEKSLHVSSWTMTGGSMTLGSITNHMSTDAMAVMFLFQFAHYVWSIPLQIIITLVLLYNALGYSSLIGSSLFIFTTPLQFWIGAKMSKVQKEVLRYSDERLKVSNELLQGIKLLKLYGWEDLFGKTVEILRSKEIGQMRKAALYMIATLVIVQSSPIMVTLISFGLFSSISGNLLTPEIAFSSLALFNQLTIPLFLLPMVFGMIVNAIVSIQRLSKFLVAAEIENKKDGRPVPRPCFDDEDEEEIAEAAEDELMHSNGPQSHDVGYKQPGYDNHASNDRTPLLTSSGSSGDYGATTESPNNIMGTLPPLPDDVAIQIQNGFFAWDLQNGQPILSDINVNIPAGKLTMVVGQVGTGKSSLLSAMLGEMKTVAGSVQWNTAKSSVAYGAQKAWLQNATLKNNILFGQPFDYRRYESVISACALKPDIEILPGGDECEIGEKGINLSGGQKQRVSVARTIYNTAQIILLDDPLSALDVHVGRTLFEDGILELLLEAKRTVVLVTHQLQYLEHADLILHMQDGKIANMGTLKEIEKSNPELHASWMQAASQAVEESESEKDPLSEEEDTAFERKKLMRQVSQVIEEKVLDEGEAGKLIQKEEREKGSVSWHVYWYYFKAIRLYIVAIVFGTYLGSVGLTVGTNFWLSAWSEANTKPDTAGADLAYWLGGYAGLSVGTIILYVVVSLVSVLASLAAAKRLHQAMLRNILKSPMRFFDTTPIGRIVNRFSSDTQLIDQRLYQTINSFLRAALFCLAALLVNAIVTPIFLIPLIPLAVLYLYIQRYFITSSREMQRLDSITKSPVYAHFSESLGGLSTIRAYRDENRFRKHITKSVNTNNNAYVYLNTANRWLGVRLDFIGAIVVLFSGLCTMIASSVGDSVSWLAIPPSYVGLAITYALQVSSYLNWVVRQTADMEMQMNSVERVDYYTRIENEKYRGVRAPPSSWPDKGDIRIEDIHVRYARDLDPVLHGINLHVKSGEKIGICGRTGSGKSSLTLALFRLIDTFQGRIIIDGFDIAELPLTDLRRKLAIIPQDPVLFSGPLRYNLDPEDIKTDDELWEALEIAQLKTTISEMDDGLDAKVSEGGENFSVGQRQLFCLARAFLRKTQILIMDEATASIDMETDTIIQEVISTVFANRTVLTIAHRVATILKSDNILVLSDGRIAEYDSPDILLEQENSIFASLVRSNK